MSRIHLQVLEVNWLEVGLSTRQFFYGGKLQCGKRVEVFQLEVWGLTPLGRRGRAEQSRAEQCTPDLHRVLFGFPCTSEAPEHLHNLH